MSDKTRIIELQKSFVSRKEQDAMTQIDELAKQLRVTTERMANICSVDMETWNDHSNAALSCADALDAQAAENDRLKGEIELQRLQMADTTAMWATRIAILEATVMEMREALARAIGGK
jgi:uncharacterized protein YigA (DUF484 family)